MSAQPLEQETRLLLLSMVVTNVCLSLACLVGLELRSAINIISGSLFLTFNLTFYTVMSAAILIKKNIAWMGPVIVIKYLFLIVSVYFIWAKGDVLLVLSGMFVELFLIIISYVILKKALTGRNTINGSL